MAYRALYRIYRPASFDEVAGQDHITGVLKNQVKLGRLSHAYLFCGPRGTGKTTMAKILARAANCLSPVEGEPCGVCEMCRISSGVNADIMEIDAASNNGVDNVRELIDQAQFSPLQLKKRVFIIDEVHMLSAGAFNALLKTLEEPPEHVLFILATTEFDKLLPTVVSRCQRFDFKRLNMPDIVAYMEKVLTKEGISAEKDALRIIAHTADGGMRDALSLLNQCISVSGNTLTAEYVRSVFGSVREDTIFNLAEKIITGDGKGCIECVETVVRSGRDLNVLARDLSDHMRSLMLTAVCGKCADLLEITQETAARYEKQAKAVSKEQLLYYCEELVKVRSSIKYFPNPRLLLETALLRMASPVGEKTPEALLSRIAALEDKPEGSVLSRVTALETEMESVKKNAVTVKYIPSAPAAQTRETIIEEQEEPPTFGTEGYEAPPETDLPAPEAPVTREPYYQDTFEIPAPVEPEYPEDGYIPPEPEYEYFCESDIPSPPEPEPALQEEASPQSDPHGFADDSVTEPERPEQTTRKVITGKEAEKVFEKIKPILEKINKPSAIISDPFTKEIQEDRLVIYYDPAKPLLVNKPRLQGYIQEAVNIAKLGLTVVIQERKQGALSKEDAHLRELFGDKLTIEQ